VTSVANNNHLAANRHRSLTLTLKREALSALAQFTEKTGILKIRFNDPFFTIIKKQILSTIKKC